MHHRTPKLVKEASLPISVDSAPNFSCDRNNFQSHSFKVSFQGRGAVTRTLITTFSVERYADITRSPGLVNDIALMMRGIETRRHLLAAINGGGVATKKMRYKTRQGAPLQFEKERKANDN
jgi:hypothetical protein